MHKIATLAAKLTLSTATLQLVFDFGPGQWLDLRSLPVAPVTAAHPPYAAWKRLTELCRVRDALPQGEVLLAKLFAASRVAGAQLDDLLTLVQEATDWDLASLQSLAGAAGLGLTVASFQDDSALVRLLPAMALLRRLGATAAKALSWAAGSLSDAAARDAARVVKGVARAKTDPGQWLETAGRLQDVLRERQRSALVAYLVARRGLHEPGELYEHLLIDVEMSPCMVTTRIKQGIGSVQLFIQRALMNLEEGASLGAREAREWSLWRKQYRVWEANRKVLLYPENWIEPELRDDKTPIFQ